MLKSVLKLDRIMFQWNWSRFKLDEIDCFFISFYFNTILHCLPIQSRYILIHFYSIFMRFPWFTLSQLFRINFIGDGFSCVTAIKKNKKMLVTQYSYTVFRWFCINWSSAPNCDDACGNTNYTKNVPNWSWCYF